jgi:peptidoglycan hydrolase-like protein with peptidoglycan-binding domain
MQKHQQSSHGPEKRINRRQPGPAGQASTRSQLAADALQRARLALASLSKPEAVTLQRTIGNRAVARLLQAGRTGRAPVSKHINPTGAAQLTIQRALSSPRFAGNATLVDISNGIGSLRRGDESDAVRKVQHGIHDAGVLFRRIGIDGKFGRETEKRVTTFQQRNGIHADPPGVVGAATITRLDQLFPAMALPATAGSPYTFAGMLAILCQWNAALVRDLRNMSVRMVGGLQWADEEFDGAHWVPKPMPGAGETSGHSIIIATNDTNEEVAKSLYHEYQHARKPRVFRTGGWGDEETYAFSVETQWAIDRGLTTDPSLTTTDPLTGATAVDPTGVASTVESYPGLAAAHPGEVFAKVGANRVRVRMPDGRVVVRNAVAGDSVPGPRQLLPPINAVPAADWRC